MWQIWIDTGGTFTDCLAVSPSGTLKRTKVLSSSFLRGRLVEKTAPNTYKIATHWAFENTLITGYSFRLAGETAFVKIVNVSGGRLELERDIALPPSFPVDFEVTTHEEAPVLATRIVTETPLSEPFPALTMRLGTTKGTNALLERKGAPVTLYVTEGFKDAVRIGTQQRPHLFQLAIPEPTLLYDEVIEVPERLDAAGNVIASFSAAEVPVPGSDRHSVAISFLHSYVNPVHERQLSDLLHHRKYASISSSSELYAGINYLKRTQTALVNAYLQPILTDYIDNIKKALGRQTLRIMTSAGGLVSADAFRAKDSLLSGPAGGMVGAAAIAQQLGFERCLTFDMGGTSTDTARFDGKPDLEFVTKIEGIELHNPTLAIETVAAGGGSICSFDGQKLRVGPESAGASPGPACYGAGGPLTVTDINLLLGKLDTSRFGIPVRIDKAREALAALQQTIVTQTGQHLTEEELLHGLEQIANEKMAEAIRRISVAKGFDPKDYPLLTFGGAGGLHGCQLAEILNISTVILPYDAGLLSAYGMGQARVERIVSRQVLTPLEELTDRLPELIEALSQTAREALLKEGIDAVEVRAILLYLRFKGQENALETDGRHLESLPRRFREKYRQLFGYCPATRSIEVESIKIIAGEKQLPQPPHAVCRAVREADPFKQMTYPVYDWEHLSEGDFFTGPAVLLNPTSTSFIPAGWKAVATPTRDIVVQRIAQTTQDAAQPDANRAVELELFTNRFMAIAEEMGAQLQRTAFSVNVKERLDFSCALLDTEAELLVNAPHIPVHLGSLGVCARLVREKIPIGPGDVIITNHPKYGGSHLPDVTILAGVFTPDERLIGYVINRAHHAEIGGRTPGSMPPDATSLDEEGVVILPTYLVKNGEMQWESMERLFTHSSYPTRALTENIADINAALASLRSGEAALQTLAAQHGLEKVQLYMKLLKDSAFEALQQAVSAFKNKKFEASETLDDGHTIQLAVTLSQEDHAPDTTLRFDFTGTSPCHPHNLNANISIIYSAILYVLRLLVNKNIPLNEGLMRGVEVVLPENSFLHPSFSDDPTQCPAVVGGNTEVSQRLVDTLLKAFELAACSQGTMNNFLFGNGTFGYYETICGGTGASRGAHGRSAVHQHMTNTRITDPEELERRYPVRLNQFSIRKGSGGKGKWHGGDGVVREIRFLEPLRVTLITQHRNVPPYGMAGGQVGQTGRQTLTRTDGTTEALAGICSLEAAAGDVLCLETPGGGGYGNLI
ncbi:hydantoinase B/oxoprolinase family protein [Runella slithyformis]|uniref:5-oxoprolinase (ATP-hydrolyzing) n=1 Tax=Runella slithyformis (strain ATCC 29530 / DSM 19594 / LMG 11500 / NCIMB 11436 / LSU 4) TaxID=761193 RepID=A0A7U3ZMZ9_RUNSL|nr:hydantoinase B/oxoprolinase family protein [Runella slithyformis]AEI50205.1 5-oxoprolinase (ATP-hydrolyzing) [Runella slithyformis DSM 19594]